MPSPVSSTKNLYAKHTIVCSHLAFFMENQYFNFILNFKFCIKFRHKYFSILSDILDKIYCVVGKWSNFYITIGMLFLFLYENFNIQNILDNSNFKQFYLQTVIFIMKEAQTYQIKFN